MNTCSPTDAWISYLLIVLGSTVSISVVGSVTLLLVGLPIPNLLLALGTVAGAGLVKLWISPLTRGLL
jgi:hypothetical protein